MKTNISLDSNRYAKSEDRFDELREIMASEEKQIVDVAEIINQEIPYEAIKESFNQICQSHQPVQTWSYWQQKKIKCLWEKYGQDLKTFQAVFEKVEASDFLSGRIKNWKARLDWLLKPNHFSDILNSKYENFEPICTKGSLVKQKWGKGFCVEMLSHDWDFDEIEQLEQRRIDSILESRGFVLC